jgi:hypothetical protein
LPLSCPSSRRCLCCSFTPILLAIAASIAILLAIATSESIAIAITIVILSTQHPRHCCNHRHLRLCLFAMSDQCALNESGGLKEAKDIEFFFSESETMPLASSAASLQQNPGNTGKSHAPLSLLS